MKHRIREIRRAKDLSRKQLAEKSGLSMSYIQKLENGERKAPGVDLAQRIAIALDTTIQEIFFGEGC